MKNTIKVVAMTTTILLTAQAEARCSWGFSSCMNPAGVIVQGFDGLDPNSIVHEVKPTMSAQEKARVMAEIEKLHKKHIESGIKDLDELYPEFFHGKGGKTYAEREAEKCWEDTWYGKKEVNCT